MLLKEKSGQISSGFESVMFVFDNASIHISKDSKEKLKEMNIQCMTISPYSPCQNTIRRSLELLSQSEERRFTEEKKKWMLKNSFK